jgi:hypothetical protein
MIAKPTTEQLIDAVRLDLLERVAPFVSNPIAQMSLQMSITVLGSAAVRGARELEWMLEEADAIEALAKRLAERLPVGRSPATGQPAVSDIAAAHARYERASELLARLAEAAYAAGDAVAIGEVWALLERAGSTRTW